MKIEVAPTSISANDGLKHLLAKQLAVKVSGKEA